MTKRIEIQEHGVMLTDYFHGTRGVQLNVYINGESTVKDVLDDLQSEINSLYDHIEYTAENHGFTIDETKEMIDKEMEKMLDYINNKGNGNKIYAPDFDADNECDECDGEGCDSCEDMEKAVAIFTIEFFNDND